MGKLPSTNGIVASRVTDWLTARIPNLTPPLQFSLVTGGNSNLTYLVVDQTGSRYVLRRPPLGHVLQTAHDMGREYRIVSALSGSKVPVPKVVGYCDDVEVTGAPFYVMHFVGGAILHRFSDAKDIEQEDRRSLGFDVIRVLANLHSIRPEEVGLGKLGRREGYLARQLKRWSSQWEATKTHEMPSMDETAALLGKKMPDQIGSSIVHGDYRLGNLIAGRRDAVDGATFGVVAVLDWELCTLGDPLADVGYLLNTWVAADEVQSTGSPLADAVTILDGFPSKAEICEHYEALTGWSLSNIDYYRAFAHWRVAAIDQGVYKRLAFGAMGERSDIDTSMLMRSVEFHAETAAALVAAMP